MSRSRNPPPRGQGAARAKQMGLLLDLSPDGGMDDEGNDEDLEAELLNLIGGGGGRPQGRKAEGKAPVHMAEIERMAALCMKDMDDEEIGDDDLDDEDLLAELNEVLEEDEEPAPTPPAVSPAAPKGTVTSHSAGGTGLEANLLERIEMYKTALSNAKAAGETSKVRRYDRGLKTLQSMLTSVKKGKPVNEEEMPPPVALGGKPNVPAGSESVKERELPEPALMPSLPTNQKPLREAPPTTPNTKPLLLTPPKMPAAAITPETPAISPLTPSQPDAQHSELKQAVLSRQREYKMAAINAKQSGDIDRAKQLYLAAKKMDVLVEEMDRGEPVDLSLLPPPPGDVLVEHRAPPPPQSSIKPAAPAAPAAPAPTSVAPADLPAPSSLAEALQQRLDVYKSAAEGAKSKGDDRKSRMHQRIVKQYQDSIKAHKAGRPVNLAELPVPPGCPPLQGSEGSQQQNFIGVLETAMKIANQDADGEDDEDGTPTESAKPAVRPSAQKAKSPAPQPPGGSTAVKLGHKAQQQVDFLLLRRQGFLRAALRSKQMKDMTGAAQHLRNAKGLDPMINAARSGLPVDATKIPNCPEEEFSLSRSRTSPVSPRSSEQYHGLMDLLRKQHEKCVSSSQQFTKVGNIPEALKFEKLAEECVKYIEILKNAHAKGHPVPKCHTEERTFNTFKSYSNLTLNDLMLYIVKGINLPAPSGVSANELDASVKFEFPFPTTEDAQRDKTSTVRNTNSPEFKEEFKLNINRSIRGVKRVQSKGIKFEIVHRGGLFKTDKVVGTAQLKLEALENHCDIREIIDVMDGRKTTGGKLEVRVKIREPLCGVDVTPVTEKWLVLIPVSSLSPPEKQKERAPSPRSKPRHEVSSSSSSSSSRSSHPSNSPPQYNLHSFSLLNYDRDRVERKIAEYRKNRRDPPSDLIHQHKQVTHRLQWQKAQLERATPALLTEYENVLRRLVQGLADSVKKFSSQGNRDAAKDALGRVKMVETELESLTRKRAG
ncbi:coiled-coil and C2 domain-containing protein 1A [Limanda limanda]|uniref:coiled-coil and C2 domain-containing protein 1A n=1 Tax=Limanda limanda TaxID=27771 RepID=UPI0029C83BB3|nr:coiled-coil and C2 domain-containing protein 1A [Limanda limanda]